MRIVRLLMIAVLLMSSVAAFGQTRAPRNRGTYFTAVAAKLSRFVIRTFGRLSPPVGEPIGDDPGVAAPGAPAVTTP